MYVYRLQTANHSAALNELTKGARITIGRWHAYLPVVYVAETSSLAILELLGYHVGSSRIKADFKLIEIEIDDCVSIKDITSSLPDYWKQNQDLTQKIGVDWFKSKETCVLKVPSIHNTKESNFLINSEHSEFYNIKVADCQIYNFSKKFH